MQSLIEALFHLNKLPEALAVFFYLQSISRRESQLNCIKLSKELSKTKPGKPWLSIAVGIKHSESSDGGRYVMSLHRDTERELNPTSDSEALARKVPQILSAFLLDVYQRMQLVMDAHGFILNLSFIISNVLNQLW